MDQVALATESVKDILNLIGDVSPEANELVGEAKKVTDQLSQRLEKAETRLAEIREALTVYATEKGDAMFLQDFELAVRMVRAKKK